MVLGLAACTWRQAQGQAPDGGAPSIVEPRPDPRVTAHLESDVPAPTTVHADVSIVRDSQRWDPPGFAFAGTFAGTVTVEALDADSGEASPADLEADAAPSETLRRPRFRLVVRLADGRRFSRIIVGRHAYDEARPFAVRHVLGRTDAFVIEVSRYYGEDCVEEAVFAYVLRPTPSGIELLANGFVGYERRAFGACEDFLSTRYFAEDGAIRVRRSIHHGGSPEAPLDATQREVLRTMRREIRDIRADAASARRAAARRGATIDELRRLETERDARIEAVRGQHAFELGRPWMVCRFPRMAERCGPERDFEDSFLLGSEPPFR